MKFILLFIMFIYIQSSKLRTYTQFVVYADNSTNTTNSTSPSNSSNNTNSKSSSNTTNNANSTSGNGASGNGTAGNGTAGNNTNDNNTNTNYSLVTKILPDVVEADEVSNLPLQPEAYYNPSYLYYVPSDALSFYPFYDLYPEWISNFYRKRDNTNNNNKDKPTNKNNKKDDIKEAKEELKQIKLKHFGDKDYDTKKLRENKKEVIYDTKWLLAQLKLSRIIELEDLLKLAKK